MVFVPELGTANEFIKIKTKQLLHFIPELGIANIIQDEDPEATHYSVSYQTWTLPTQFIKMKIQKLLTTQFQTRIGHCQLNSSR